MFDQYQPYILAAYGIAGLMLLGLTWWIIRDWLKGKGKHK